MLSVFGVCATCGAQLEFAVPAAGLAGRRSHGRPGGLDGKTGRHYRLRAVTTDDLLATLGAPETGAAADLLLARCLEVSRRDGPARGRRRATLQRFEQLNAASELSCSVDCPACSSRELLDLDMARFLWKEVRNAARRLLGEIHRLASAYGWSERAIAEMSPGRRAAYLEMLSA